MPTTQHTVTDLDIFRRLIDGPGTSFSAAEAEAILKIGFGGDDEKRMARLAARNNAGKLTPKERAELESYVRVGDVLGLLKSRARTVLRNAGPGA